MKSQITIFESGTDIGIMSRNKKFYDEKLSTTDINSIFLNTRLKLGKKYNFNGKKIFQALQKTDINNVDYKDGKYIILDEKYMTKEDFWYEELPADILIITSNYKNIVVGNQMADCPVLIVEDRNKGVTALAHCGASYINRNLPYQTVESLIKQFQSNKEDLYVYIGSCIKKESYIYDTYPSWATNRNLWKDCIEKTSKGYEIDLVKAIIKQLTKLKISNIEISPYDTATSDKFYSYRMAKLGNTKKKGQNFVGFYYN